MLAVVQEQQHLPVGELVGQLPQRWPGRLHAQPERGRHQVGQPVQVVDLLGERPRAVQLGQIDEPHTIRERPPQLRRHAQRHPGLARTPDPRQRHQPAVGQQSLDVRHLAAATDEAGQLGRKTADPGTVHGGTLSSRHLIGPPRGPRPLRRSIEDRRRAEVERAGSPTIAASRAPIVTTTT